MSVLGKRQRPGGFSPEQRVSKKKKINKNISSESEDDDLECRKMIYEKMRKDINDLKNISNNEKKDYENYYSVNRYYDPNQKWKLFFSSDYHEYKYCITNTKC